MGRGSVGSGPSSAGPTNLTQDEQGHVQGKSADQPRTSECQPRVSHFLSAGIGRQVVDRYPNVIDPSFRIVLVIARVDMK